MNMKEHILAALREQLDRWEDRLRSMSSDQITAPDPETNWSVKDNIAHLMAWQRRSIARFEAAVGEREPVFPTWIPGVDPDAEGNMIPTNAWIYEIYRDQPWTVIHAGWKGGFLRLLELCGWISEKDLLDASRYPWLDGRPLAVILLATYDHHQEHFEKLWP